MKATEANRNGGDEALGGRRYDTGQVRATPNEEPDCRAGAIAVIGVAGFFPGSTSLEDFCGRLDRQESLFVKPPANHFPASIVSDRYGAFLDQIAQFDPAVFKITPLEAEYLDPRQRLLLMSVWHSLEDACYSPDALSKSRTDVYIASEGSPYTAFVREAEITPYSPTGPSSWSLPNRISHAFRFRGKSIFINTACSGSLVAMHQAMQALRKNETDYAVVGAANLLFGDQVLLAYLGQESLGILGDSHACYPFQNNARGFLPAEGVVTVVLKRLSDAVRDNDNIHVVLLGSHVNHAGGGGTLTMPSAEAQSEAIVGAYVDAGIPPWTVTYIEAHGASSVLADVEEIEAFKIGDRKLRNLFSAETPSPCKISTIKPNIGHASSVSGLMSLVRVAYSLKHEKKLGIKDFSGCNDRISLDSTRFYINETTESWEQLIDERGLPIPRRAAINNFGAGGVNVHLLVEEFVRPPVESSLATNAVYFLALSAVHADQLQKQVVSLLAHITDVKPSIPPEDLEALFLSSRKAFPRRLVFRYKSLDELREKLGRYREASGAKGYHLKRDTRDQNDSVELFYKHQKLSEFLSTLAEDTDKGILFELWSLGIEEPINNYFKGNRCVKRSLPRYPFDMKEFWVKPLQRTEGTLSGVVSPLLQQNTSDLLEQSYSSLFSGDEFFLADHIVQGKRVLPGVAYLEMARAAVAQATRTSAEAQGIRLRNIVWTRPIVLDEGQKTIHIRLKPGDDGRIDFEIHSAATVHCQGSASLMSAENVPVLDLKKHQLECDEFTLGADQCYRAFKAVGIDHGPAFQGLEVIHGKIGQAVAKIVLPASVLASQNQFVLHPSIMDCAFQASIGLAAGPTQATLPFALRELEVFSPCTPHTWAIIHNSADSSSTSKVRRVDIDLCDDDGRISVRMRGFATRPVEGDGGEAQANSAASRPTETIPEELPSTRRTPNHRLQDRIEAMLARALVKVVGTTDKSLDRNAEFSTFGLDSVSLTAFANDLNRAHGLELDPTLFFEHSTIRQFAGYLAHAHGEYFGRTFAIALENPQRSSPQPPVRLPEDSKTQTRFSAGPKPLEASGDSSSTETIAIVGISGRFPMAEDINEFWQNLVMGRDCISEVPSDRWDWREIYGDPKTEENKTNIKWGGFISGVDEFDPLFFGISPKEAELMDPQQRLLMTFMWNAIEDAGYAAQRLSGTNTGVFVGTGASGYSSIIAKANVPIEAYTSTGMVPSVGPNRMSYYLNFHGPSEPIETACSSSLVAIHRAVAAIRSGSCDMAIAGGVSTMLTPDLHISFSKAGMLCEDGRCKTFSDGANGYVRGEGVGMLFLKKLKDAERDGDDIYGVILGSAENHGGRTNSLTAPNPKAQADVVIAAHKSGGVDPRSISYVEAHGTGTGLGDPIEINGLKLAFSETDASATSYCGVGSVKTNIGHLELAAGVSGVIKVLLQMKHKRLVKSLNCETVNPYIQFEGSPFYFVSEAVDWQALRDTDGKDLPRRAGVSSFGFGGVNAHVVLEEYVRDPLESTFAEQRPVDGDPGFAILLSARNADRLRERTQQLHDYLRENSSPNGSLRIEEVAFTLQVGRDAMDERLALIVDSVKDLEEKLARVLAGREESEDIYRGKVERQNSLLSMFRDDEELNGAVEGWLQRGKVRKLSELWVKGLAVDWEKLYRPGKPHRLHLPVYPFARQRCWVTTRQASPLLAGVADPAGLIHPLVHHNASTLREQRYRSTFSGNEFFLAEHVLRGMRILPGVVYLEMARAAIHHATRDSADWKHVRLQKVAWTSPFTVDSEPRQINLALSPEPDGSISFSIFSETENAPRELHFQGVAVRGEIPQPATIDLAELRVQCNVASMSSQESYEISERLGFQYGPSFMALGHVYKGIDQVAATIRLPAQSAKSLNEYVLHPSVMDAALQASMALVPVASPALPYFAGEIEILRPCTASMWAVVRPTQIRSSGLGNVRTCDIDVCDDNGSICVRLKGMSFVLSDNNTAVLAPVWRETKHTDTLAPESEGDKLLVLCEVDDASVAEIRKRLNASYRLLIASLPASEPRTIDERFEECAIRLFEEIKQSSKKTLVQVVVPLIEGDGTSEQQMFSGLSGMLLSAQRENSKIVGQIVEWLPTQGVQDLLQNLVKDSGHPEDHRIRYRDGKRWTLDWATVPKSPKPPAAPWKDNGTYLIAGGAGALGQVFVNEIVEQVQTPTIIITGRHPISHYSLPRLREWHEKGARVEFRQVDIGRHEQVAELLQEVRQHFKKLDGVLHCAGVIKDNSISNKSTEDFREVLAPKVSGVVCLDQATRELPLDFLVLFSSIAATVGNAGQADYAAANAFMDNYAAYRNGLVQQGKCSGGTLSVNWPFWKEGGMRISAELLRLMRQSTGLLPLETVDGVEAFYRALASDQSQVMVVSGNVSQIQRVLVAQPTVIDRPGLISPSESPSVDILDEVQKMLLTVVSGITKVESAGIDLDGDLTQYGFDSISLIALADTLNKSHNLDLTPAVFFEYPSIRSLSAYLLERYRLAFEDRYSSAKKETDLPGTARQVSDQAQEPPPLRPRFLGDSRAANILPSKPSSEPIAIVGMSGRFPMADDIQQFWDNLLDAKDCIGEIPSRRWDWKEYFGDPRKDGNKTNVKWGGFISGVDEFDPLFFGISPKEAELMDPNQRLLMEYVWKAIEDAGYSAQSLSGSRTAIIVGMGSSGYHSLMSAGDMAIESFTSTGMAPSLGPNRMSYFLNFHGPSEPIETACSSSLIALHRARILLQNDLCDTAVVGGVSTMVTPLLHISFSKAGMLCEDGRCKTFSDKANGYARGEGVGMLLLKRLKDAEQAGDHIYGVVLGSAENHGGHATSLTAPNPHAQAEVIRTAYSGAGVDPRTIGYIEAHGTGTGLGDPVEINALKSVFKDSYQAVDGAYCGIGSVKSNIGHLELAAGVAGIIKVLLQLRHKRLAKTLHCETVSPYIDLKDSPFYILQEARDWQPIQDASGNELPRRAGISSFGFGGVNAHVVVEEYRSSNDRKVDEPRRDESFAIVLSAKSTERLQVIVRNLYDFLERGHSSQPDLQIQDLAYTLQVGRDAMEERMGIVVHSLEELRRKLETLSRGAVEVEGVYRGTVKRREGGRGLDVSIEGKPNTEILEMWVQGLAVDWSQFYLGTRPRRLSLPTYPFAEEKYWIDTYRRTSAGSIATTGRIHPLVQENSSTLQEQMFRSVFSGSEFFLEDHIVNGRRVLPAVVYLEMARAAVVTASGDSGGGKFIRIKNVVWPRPFVVDEEPGHVVIQLYPDNGPGVRFEIRSADKDQVYSHGTVLISAAPERPTLDLKPIREACSESFSASECYELFATAGVDYGTGHRGLEGVYVGNRQVLARLSLPLNLAGSEREYVLHPSMVDSAIQSVAGLLLSRDEANRELSIKAGLPFSVEEVEIFGGCEAKMWAILRPAGAGISQRFDVEIVNDRGQCCIRLRGLSSRQTDRQDARRIVEGREKTLLYRPRMVESGDAVAGIASRITRRVVVLCGSELKPHRTLLEADNIHCLQIESSREDVGQQFEDFAIGLFEEAQRVLRERTDDETLIQVIVPHERHLLTGLRGLLAVVERENSRCHGQLIAIDLGDDANAVVEQIRNDSCHPEDTFVRYMHGRRQICRWEKVKSPEAAQPPWKDHGVYLLTGGAGGLGWLVAKEIADAVEGPTLILTGRSATGDEIASKVEQIERLGARVCYWTMDVANRNEVAVAVAAIQREFGGLNGIIHAAGIVRDTSIARKETQEFREVLAAKVEGLVNLDLETQAFPLDFFLLFSSAAAVWGNVGQADYATANAFMDAYAGYRNGLVEAKQRYGRTLSINWPLWKEGRMQVPADLQKVMERRFGIVPLPTVNGIQALSQSFASDSDQVLVLHGEPESIDARVSELSAPSQVPTAGNDQPDQPLFASRSLDYLRKVLSTVIKLPAERIDVDAPLENYGIDSVMAMELTDALEKVFGSLSKTLFFEYQTIRELSGFFVQNHRDKLIEVMGMPRTGNDDSRKQETRPVDSVVSISAIEDPQRTRFAGGEGSADIAIIGLSGRYPGADTISEFWRNLQEGRDSITEIPRDRWDHSLYFDEDKSKPGKTYGKWGGFLRGVDEFDPLFFNISPRDAEYIDPQERLFLQCVYETIEDAGYTRQSLAQYRDASGLPGNVGVYVGVMYEEYQLYGAQETIQGRPIALAGNPSSIANRVSYFFNFHGPSLALDTMCSSSLTALHLACDSLRLAKCDVAVAGGVNVSVHPNKYLMLGQGKFVSSKGRCESFGEGGDGYVPSEGVGAVLLKTLDRAKADGDRIYGVIKATAINHGGKTNGYSVPNPNAQASVIEKALEEAGVHPRTISYLEAHGTGTSLGDPIEIAGLNKAFQKYTQDRQFCAIGSVKSNIGHCESAAGIGGLTKVLLQMQHARLVPSLHSKTLNEAIDFAASPFVVQQESGDWHRPVIALNGAMKEYPRIAGLSSFGAGGSNAHVLVEEYIPEDAAGSESVRKVPRESLLVLSAKNEDRLLTIAQNLHDFIRESGASGRAIDLADLAYTLQVGREVMEERVAFVVGSMEDVQSKLKSFTKRETAVPGIYRGKGRENTDILSLLVADGDLQETVNKWIDEGRNDRLAALWVGGLSVDWRRLYGNAKPRRISLPTYPFERERYWVPKAKRTLPPVVATGRSAIHPLLHENTSTFSEQRFSTIFTGEEPFLTDHRVQGHRVLPGVAHLEMARAGIEQASQIQSDDTVIVMRNVVWLRPVMVSGGERVHLGLSADEDGRIGYEVYGEPATDGGEPVVYSRGTVLLRAAKRKRDSAQPQDWTELPRLDISTLQSRCESGSLEPDECYAIYRNLGIDYGPAHRGIEKIHVGAGEVLAKLRLSTEGSSGDEKYILHPGMMDSALQASIGIFAGEGGLRDLSSLKPALPFALDEIEVFGRLTPVMWAYIRPSAGSHSGGKVRKLDIDVCDEGGNVCARLKGLSSRELTGDVTLAASTSAVSVEKDVEEGIGTFLLAPVWDSVSIDGNILFPPSSSAMAIVGGSESLRESVGKQFADIQRLTVEADDTIDRIAERIRALPGFAHLLWVAPSTRVSGVTDETLITSQRDGVLLGFRLIKALLRAGFGSKSLGMTVITTNSQRITPHDVVDPAHASIHGLIGAVAKEYPAWQVRLLDLEADREWPLAEIFRVPADAQGDATVYRHGEWYKQQLIQFDPQESGGIAVSRDTK